MKCANCKMLIMVNELVVPVLIAYRSEVTLQIEVRPLSEAYAHLFCSKKGK